MDVILAGHNIDYDIIREIAAEYPQRQDLTPETVAAAYARISRYPRPVSELRRIARGEVEKARASNRNIVFEMGHSSIAEHAVFNLDVLGVSRLLVEEIERFRLASYTEKSQRYVLLKDDFVIPAEIRQAGLEEDFVAAIRLQNGFYHELYEKLRPHVFGRNPGLAADPANRSLLEGWAKEDARYILALATETQLGMTINARNIELMIRRLAACPLAEAKEYSRRLYGAARDVAPSLVRYTESTAYDLETRGELRQRAEKALSKMRAFSPNAAAGKGLQVSSGANRPAAPEQGPPAAPEAAAGSGDDLVRLVAADPRADDRVAAALLHGVSLLPLERCLEAATAMEAREKEGLFRVALRRMKAYDAAPREFEHASLTFELTISATCFAQVKRHRMATITVQDYDPALGVTIPSAVTEIGMERPFRDACARTEEAWEKIRRAAPEAASYVLTNAHRRRVAVRLNARELYHLARVRADRNAQWDIRETARRMVELGREAMPLTLMLAAGKDGFEPLYARIFAGQD